ncbi:hypothetical protein CU005_0535 [Enterococcus faecium]|nr:hypothetical protein [Enterococcus faecium]MBK4847286.1 hypothetical protein [Enterococcus faecium]MBK4851934.1 hypothetical protein [Enterococcus faecium]
MYSSNDGQNRADDSCNRVPKRFQENTQANYSSNSPFMKHLFIFSIKKRLRKK